MKELWETEWIKPECGFGDSYIKLPFSPKQESILEVGCGDLKDSPFPQSAENYVGLDISYEALRRAKPCKYKKVIASAIDLPFRDNSFDMVVSIDILSTLGSDIITALKEMKRVSKNRLYFNVSHAELKYRWTDVTYYKQEDFSLGVGRELDVAIFTEDEMERLLKKLNLESVVIQAFNGDIQRVSKEIEGNARTPAHFLKWMIYVVARKK